MINPTDLVQNIVAVWGRRDSQLNMPLHLINVLASVHLTNVLLILETHLLQSSLVFLYTHVWIIFGVVLGS